MDSHYFTEISFDIPNASDGDEAFLLRQPGSTCGSIHERDYLNGKGMSLLSVSRRGIARKSNIVGLIKTQGEIFQQTLRLILLCANQSNEVSESFARE